MTVKGWSVDVRTHRIGEIINKILVDPWPGIEPDDTDMSITDARQNYEAWYHPTAWSRRPWGRKGPGKDKPGSHDGHDGDEGWEKHGGVPKAEADDECIDCYKWFVIPTTKCAS